MLSGVEVVKVESTQADIKPVYMLYYALLKAPQCQVLIKIKPSKSPDHDDVPSSILRK